MDEKIPGRKYQTQFNGGDGYLVAIKKGVASIYTPEKKLKKEFKIKKAFIGKDPNTDYPPGNTVLLSLGENEYVFVCDNVYKFKTQEPITKYYSRIGNSSVPYPYASSRNYVYLMIENGRTLLRKDLADPSLFEDPYDYYYNNKEIDHKKKAKGYKEILKSLFRRK